MNGKSIELPRPQPARRLTFRYDGSDVKLVSDIPITVIVQPSHALDDIEKRAGFALVLRDASGRAIYRRAIDNPIRHDVEVFSPTDKETITRLPKKRVFGTFSVIVPDLEQSKTLEFFGHPLEPKAHIEPVKRLAHFDLTKRQR